MKARFVKGHMGGNTIALFRRDSFLSDRKLELVLEALRNEDLACHEAGLLSPGSSQGHLGLAIVGRSSANWISACGGLTQVLGHAFADRTSCEHLGLDLLFPPATVVLETEAGPTPVNLVREGGKLMVWTDMTAFLEELYRDGFEELVLCGFPTRRIGKFLAIDADVLRNLHPDDEIQALGPRVRQTLTDIQRAFFRHMGRESRDLALYDDRCSHKTHFRITFPHYLPEGHIEPACGTGTVAAGLALFLAGKLEDRKLARAETDEIIFESGGGPSLGGPERTLLRLEQANGRICRAHFSHNRVELTAVGDVFLPDAKSGR